MKKILLILTLIFIIILSSCSALKKKDDNNKVELNHYEFLDTVGVSAVLSTYDIVIKNGNDTYEFIENDKGLFFSNNSNAYLLSKGEHVDYVLDIANQEKQEKSINMDIAALRYSLIDYLDAHYEIKDSLYVLEEKTAEVAGEECSVYSLENKDTKTKESYYVTSEGLCFKRILTSPSKTVSWEVVKYSTNKTIIDVDMDDYFNFETTIPFKTFNSWPTTELANLIPEFKAGSFVTASDNGKDCTIYFSSVSLTNFNEYVEKVKKVGFDGGNSDFDGNQIYKYVANNSDNIKLEIAFDQGQYQIRIELIKEVN